MAHIPRLVNVQGWVYACDLLRKKEQKGVVGKDVYRKLMQGGVVETTVPRRRV
jgi:hypothetical protein